MMNPAILKGSLALVAVSGLATTGAYFSGLFDKKDKSFRNYLGTIGRTVASSPKDWNELKELYSSVSDVDLIPNISKESVKDSSKPLTDWCEGKLKSDYNDSEKNLVESWCSKTLKIGDRLSHFNLLALNTATTSGTANADDGTWTSKSQQYGSDTTADATLKVNEVNDSPNPKTLGSEISSTIEKDKLKKWCDWAKDQAYQYETSVLFKKYRHWCTKKRFNSF